jgi:AAA15 family ATPase/GTPase
MDRLRIQNLRSLIDTEYVELRPLTVLVGKNSSGKSTFLDFFH